MRKKTLQDLERIPINKEDILTFDTRRGKGFLSLSVLKGDGRYAQLLPPDEMWLHTAYKWFATPSGILS